MKSIVLEIKRDEAVILSDDGTVSKIRNKNYSIGQVISMENTKKAKSKFYTFAASFVAAMIILTVGVFAYFTPVSYVSLDVNPSIEYSINLFDRVLTYKSVNDDGKEIVEKLNLKNKKIAQALEETLNKIVEEGYITKDENAGVVISISDSSKAEVLVKEIMEKTKECLAENDETDEAEVDVEVEAVGRERVKEARKLGITPGKLNLIEKLRDSTDNPEDFIIEDWMDKSVKEINKAVKENRKNKKTEDNIDIDDTDNEKDDEKDKEDAEEDEDENEGNTNKPVKEKNKEKNKNKDKEKSNNCIVIDRYDDDDDDDDDDDKLEKDKNKEKNSEGKNNNGKNIGNDDDDVDDKSSKNSNNSKKNNSKNNNKKDKSNNGKSKKNNWFNNSLKPISSFVLIREPSRLMD